MILFLPNHHASVFLSTTEYLVPNSRPEELMDIQLRDIITSLAVRSQLRCRGREGEDTTSRTRAARTLEYVSFYSMVQWYLGNRFRNSSRVSVRFRAPAQRISSNQGAHDPGSKDLGYINGA